MLRFDEELPVMYLPGERHLGVVKQMATSANGQLVLIPGDLQATIRGLMGNQ